MISDYKMIGKVQLFMRVNVILKKGFFYAHEEFS